MKLEDFNYYLREELIAQTPLKDRSSSKLMVLDRKTREIQHKVFKDIIDYIDEGDCLVLNNTRVIPARLFGIKEETNGKMEFLLLKRIDKDTWETLVKPGKRAKIGNVFIFGDGKLKAEILDIIDDGKRIVKFIYEGIFEEILDDLGQMPLPPYIKEKLEDKERYQTVYSKEEGSSAAPTAGLHFTNDLIKKLQDKGVKIAYVTLHVGLGTFRPVKVENIEEHKMHTEYYVLDEENADLINKTKENGKKVIAVGTTSCRTLETIGCNGRVKASSGWTDIFIYPGYKFEILDLLITNFHLPESTLLMLVSAFSDREFIMNAYKIATEENYRFFSFGDAMLIK
ncbi:MAG: tRNA preQ1(34) S-adenosylmethionine ribosyltransferase-isomerase QueA [Clostridiaceae bacterium]